MGDKSFGQVKDMEPIYPIPHEPENKRVKIVREISSFLRDDDLRISNLSDEKHITNLRAYKGLDSLKENQTMVVISL